MRNDLFLGIDIGSVTIKTVLLDADARVLFETYARIQGDPLTSLADGLDALGQTLAAREITAAGITGSGGKQAAGIIGAAFLNEVIRQAAFASRFHPDARTIIEMGGEDAKLITLARGAASPGAAIEDFSMNAARS